MRRFSVLVAVLLMFAPSLAEAKSVTTWDLVDQEKIEGWKATNIETVQLRPEGLLLATGARGQLVKAANIRHDVDTIAITYASNGGAGGIFFWHTKGMPPTEAYQIPISFPPTAGAQTTVMDMSRIKEWDTSKIDSLGFALDAGSEMILKSMEFSGPGFVDTIVFPLRSFFLLDNLHAYSINFLWGPLMTFGEDQMQRLYSQVPPLGKSMNIVFYVLFTVLLAAAFLLRRWKNGILCSVFVIVFSASWILYDFRMGAEFIEFARKDLSTWWSKPAELKDYRDRGSFNAFALTVAPYAEGKEKYVFIASHNWPYVGTIQYETYPAYPVAYEEDTTDVDTWIVYNRHDITQDAEGRLTLGGNPISPPGSILLQFEPGAFVFVTNPNP